MSRPTVTNDRGGILFPALCPGTYTPSVEAPGFKKMDQQGIAIATQTAVTRAIAYPLIRQVTETIDVTSEAELLATSEASTGSVIDQATSSKTCRTLGREPLQSWRAQ